MINRNYGKFATYELHNSDLQIVMPFWATSQLQQEIDSDEFEYPSFEDILEPIFHNGWELFLDEEPDIPFEYGPYFLYYGSLVWRYEGKEHPTQVLASQGYINLKAVYYGPEPHTGKREICRIHLIPGGVVFVRGTPDSESSREYKSATMTAASRLRLNDYLADGVRYKMLDVIPYVGPGWNGAIISFTDPEPLSVSQARALREGK